MQTGKDCLSHAKFIRRHNIVVSREQQEHSDLDVLIPVSVHIN